MSTKKAKTEEIEITENMTAKELAEAADALLAQADAAEKAEAEAQKVLVIKKKSNGVMQKHS